MTTQPVTESPVFQIPSWKMDYFKKRIEKLQARARKLGCSEPQVVDRGYDDVPEIAAKLNPETKRYEQLPTGRVDRYFKVEVTGQAPSYGGWTFVASLDRMPEAGNLVRVAPGQKIPERYRTEEPHCDQCKQVRNRIKHYVVFNEAKGYRMVGSGCIRDFLGHETPEHVALIASFWSSLSGELDEASRGGSYSEPEYLNLEVYLSYVSASIMAHGWMGAARARQEDRTSTRSTALSWMFHKAKDCKTGCLHPTAEDEALARKAIDWAKGITVESDFDHNLNVLAQSEVMPYKGAGIAAAMVYCYKRKVEDEILREKEKSNSKSEHLAKVGDRIDVLLTVLKVFFKDGDFGTTSIYKMTDETGNMVTWFSSTGGLEVGETYKVRGTVKAHDEYKGIKQTVLTRCKAVLVKKEAR